MATKAAVKKPGVHAGAVFEKNKDGTTKRCPECGQALRVRRAPQALTAEQIEKRRRKIAAMQKNLDAATRPK